MKKSDIKIVVIAIDQPAETFADLFLCLRYELDCDQCSMAAVLGVSQSALSKFENGRLIPASDVFIKAMRYAMTTPKSGRRFLEFCMPKGIQAVAIKKSKKGATGCKSRVKRFQKA